MARLTQRWLRALIELDKGNRWSGARIGNWVLDILIEGVGQNLFGPDDTRRVGFGSVG